MDNLLVDRWARTLVGYSVRVRPGDRVVITAGVAGEPLVRAVHREVVRAGGHPILRLGYSGLDLDLQRHGSDEQLAFIGPLERFVQEEAEVSIHIRAETNSKALSQADPARTAAWTRARTELTRIAMQRGADGSRRWVLTLWPTDAYAQDAEMATADFADFVARACKLDQPDPGAAWRATSAEQARLIAWLAGKREVRVQAPGTDLRLSVAGRTWVNADGRTNVPDGEIFTGPVEESAEGHVRFSFPVVRQGHEVRDVRLRFAAGEVIDASATQNEAYLIETIDTDPNARRIGEFAFGTNFGIDRVTKSLLFDEKIGGTCHLALGGGYPETGSRNVSPVHWDMICDLRRDGAVDVDGEPFVRDGRFVA